jgi:Flp pilus assembly protein TadG
MNHLDAKRIYSELRDDRGSQLVEFALSIMVLLTLVFGMVDFSRAMYSYHFASYAAQEGARYAMVRGASWTSACSTSAPPNFTQKYGCIAAQSDVQNYVRNLTMAGISQSNLTVTTTWPGTTPTCTSSCSACSPAASKGCYVKVKVNYKFTFMFGFLPKTALNFAGTSMKVIQK